MMRITRRDFVVTAGAAAVVAAIPAHAALKGTSMYGLIGKMKVAPGQRDALTSILLEGLTGMPGCLSYIVAQNPTDPDALWITEAWDSKASHQASLSLPSVQEAIGVAGHSLPVSASDSRQHRSADMGLWRFAQLPDSSFQPASLRGSA